MKDLIKKYEEEVYSEGTMQMIKSNESEEDYQALKSILDKALEAGLDDGDFVYGSDVVGFVRRQLDDLIDCGNYGLGSAMLDAMDENDIQGWLNDDVIWLNDGDIDDGPLVINCLYEYYEGTFKD